MDGSHLVTGAFGYSGRYIARELLDAGHTVRTLTRSPHRDHPFGDQLRVFPLDFEDRAGLLAALSGVRVLYNTYWVRFSKAGFSQERAVRNTRALFEAAEEAGVQRVVHVSITNPSMESPYEYFRGKAMLEDALGRSGLSHAILRPAVIFGGEDVLINNLAWMLRRFPVFGLVGDGSCRLQPIHVEDFAKLAVRAGAQRSNAVIDAVGPETFTYRELVEVLGAAIGRPRRLLSTPLVVIRCLAWVLGHVVGDVVLTSEEISALQADLLVTDSPPAGTTRLSEWVKENADSLGTKYSSELARRRDRRSAYSEL